MPKLVNSLSAKEKYNLGLGLIGHLMDARVSTLDELSEVFQVEAKLIKDVLKTLNVSSSFLHGWDDYPFIVNIDEEDGTVEFGTTSDLDGRPKISRAQASALSAGLTYLGSLPEFADDKDIAAIQEIFRRVQGRNEAPMIEVKPGTVSAQVEKVIEAIRAHKRLKMEYRDRGGSMTVREIDPVLLIESDGHPAVTAYCHLRKEQRNFRIDHMSKVEVLDIGSSDQAEELFANLDDLSEADYNPGEHDYDVKVRIHPEAYPLAAHFTNLEEQRKNKGGSFEIVIKVGRLDHLGPLIAKYGGAAQVLEPAEARDIVRDYALWALGERPLSDTQIEVE
jgi:proteasome accessory factor C